MKYNKKKLSVICILMLAILFSLTYYLVDRSVNNKNLLQTSQEKINTDIEVNKLEDSVKVSLFAGDKKESDMTVAQIKQQLNIDGDLTKDELIKILKNSGYALDITSNNQIMFKKDSSSNLEPNKYYIGEKDGYLAIYETDVNGNASVKNNEDIFLDNKPVQNLREVDKSKIKNFELKYDTKDEAEESVSELIS
ncbi:hypothetical protein FDB55_07975 [Clostridium botulinum]|uniref:Uncharacterized protein n=1 Tax=Clostridium botulinum TaxID=1491 RepID=A0A0C2S7X0_CLOBO|nr:MULTISPECIES: hypothetical protein [Clostridium]ACD51052.1 conserved hypothetical protein [Clostridium botulinum E3 str. Alaska E43]AJF28973.1 hypothetical protein ST13_04555 [Clostridium botulinum]AJF32034.1 hypothetical protein ST12_04555 [Clostridium botulinum]KAI3350374.1 hypothetical protein CIT18_03175 [Clostridium botulinum]KIL09167.1 hypothetical protein SR42_09365 [Clostridium botulinum]